MPTPIIPEELFRVNDEIVVQFGDGVVVIDNYYKNYEEIYNVLSNMHVSRWKSSPTSKNFKDYYDCRPVIPCFYPDRRWHDEINTLSTIIRDLYKEDTWPVERELYTFNFLKHINVPSSNDYQCFPHIDEPAYIGIIFLDKVCSGGTAIYPEINSIKDQEKHDLFVDVSSYKKHIISAKPNRMIIFKGKNLYHGGYIEDHNAYKDDWRMNQVLFFNTK